MRLVRFRHDGNAAYGIVDGDLVYEISGKPYETLERTGDHFELAKVTLLAPTEPEKIIGIGLNYMDHIRAQGLQVPTEPYIVHRPLNTLNVHLGIVKTRADEHFVQYEGELVIVIGKSCKNVTVEHAADYIFGYTIGNDVTEKDYFKAEKHFGVAKAFDTQCPVGPWIVTEYDWQHKRIQTLINGRVRQDGNTDSMIFDCNSLVSYLSSFMTLQPGDLIMTGSPAGVGPLSIGDTVEVVIEGIGTLTNKIEHIE